jgi:RND family efflux transporter MFP subunit
MSAFETTRPTAAPSPATSDHPLAPAVTIAPASKRARVVFYIFGIHVLVLTALAAAIIGRRHRARDARDLAAKQEESQKGPAVLAIKATRSTGARTVVLLGDAQPYRQTTLYAKVSGYLKEVRFDKGDHVKQGDILGVIESPEADQTVVASGADLAVKADTEQRYRTLVKQGIVSQLEMDRAVGALRVATADHARARSARDYAVIRAPFDGVITSRSADLGALLQAATSSMTNALPLMDIADLSRMRVRLYLGAFDAPFVHVGDTVTLWTDAEPEKKSPATVSRITRALDAHTRTMLCEVDVDNANGALYAGTPVHASLQVPIPPAVVVPSEAIVLRGSKTVIATVKDGHAAFQPVTVADDDGMQARVSVGVKEGEVVLLRVSDEVIEGGVVRPVLKPAGSGK